MKARIRTRRLAASCLLLAANQVAAFDLGQSGTVHAVAAASLQCQLIGEGSRGVDACRGAAPLQPELEWHPSARDRLHLKLGFAAGNGLSEVSPFTLSPWAADLEADTRDINGSGRNYLLTVWWRHHFELSPPFGLATTLGLIDSTDYLDNNAYANDEYTQFMNEALVNGPNAFLPSYDPGAAIELEAGRWSLHGVAMRVGEDTDDSQFGFYGGQLAYHRRSPVGSGTYRLLVTGTSEDLLDPAGNAKERRTALLVSVDQALGANLGGFLRLGWQNESAGDGYRAIYSGGIDIGGSAWNREQDNIGFGYAYLNGSPKGLRRTQVAEIYYRWAVDDSFAVTADLQYLRDEEQIHAISDGLILGSRFVLEF